MGRRYSPEQIEYLLSLRGLSGKEVAARFNSKFGTDKDGYVLLKLARTYDSDFRLSKDYYSEKEDDWLEANRPLYTRRELADLYNAIFNKDRSLKAIDKHCREKGFSPSKKVKQVPWHDGMTEEEIRSHYTDESWRRSRFQRGVSGATKRYTVGDEVLKKCGGRGKAYIYVKISEDPTVPTHDQWVAKHRLVWEQERGPIPEGHLIIFLDGDSTNCAIENLACIPVRFSGMINSRHLLSEDPDINKLILKWCELEDTINQQAERGIL